MQLAHVEVPVYAGLQHTFIQVLQLRLSGLGLPVDWAHLRVVFPFSPYLDQPNSIHLYLGTTWAPNSMLLSFRSSLGRIWGLGAESVPIVILQSNFLFEGPRGWRVDALWPNSKWSSWSGGW